MELNTPKRFKMLYYIALNINFIISNIHKNQFLFKYGHKLNQFILITTRTLVSRYHNQSSLSPLVIDFFYSNKDTRHLNICGEITLKFY